MNRYVALLRGINVSGKNIMSMKALKELFVDVGMKNVTTYIQSGNVVFETESADNSDISKKLETAISKVFGYEVPVIIRSKRELREIIVKNPFASEDEKMLYITFLKENPDKEVLAELQGKNINNDEIRIIDKNAYLLIRNGYGNTKLSNAFIEKKMRADSTTRNIKTVKKLIELADDVSSEMRK
ncbi:MAG: DUF1697 domain-containing protein [Ignavibacteria bacterium]|nr:DUF1697 domain-containing protein [Ignavibacteria bacterium]